MTVSQWLALIFNAFLLVTCGYALLCGALPERLGAAINLAASGLTTILRLASSHFFAPAEVAVLSIDVVVVAGFFWLAVRSTRFWPVWAFGFALANVGVSLAGALLPKTPLFAYHTSLGIYAYLALGALALGTFRTTREAASQKVWRK